MTKPAPVPRVARDRRDDRYDAHGLMPAKRAGAGWVVAAPLGPVQFADDPDEAERREAAEYSGSTEVEDTVAVEILGEIVTGVIYLHDKPPIGSLVEVETRGDLLVIPRWYEHPRPPGRDLIPLTAEDYFFRGEGSYGDDAGATDHYLSNTTIFHAGVPQNQVPIIEAHSEWGSSVHTDDNTGYATSDDVGFDAALRAAFGLGGTPGTYHLSTLGAMSRPADIPADVWAIRWRIIVRVRCSIQGWLGSVIRFGTLSGGYDYQRLPDYVTPVGPSGFTRYESPWYGHSADYLREGHGELLMGGDGGTFDAAYMALEVEWDWEEETP